MNHNNHELASFVDQEVQPVVESYADCGLGCV